MLFYRVEFQLDLLYLHARIQKISFERRLILVATAHKVEA